MPCEIEDRLAVFAEKAFFAGTALSWSETLHAIDLMRRAADELQRLRTTHERSAEPLNA